MTVGSTQSFTKTYPINSLWLNVKNWLYLQSKQTDQSYIECMQLLQHIYLNHLTIPLYMQLSAGLRVLGARVYVNENLLFILTKVATIYVFLQLKLSTFRFK